MLWSLTVRLCCSVPEDYKINPGGVEAIAEHPSDPNKMVIGYSRGLMVLWDNESLNADQTYICNKVNCWLLWQLNSIMYKAIKARRLTTPDI